MKYENLSKRNRNRKRNRKRKKRRRRMIHGGQRLTNTGTISTNQSMFGMRRSGPETETRVSNILQQEGKENKKRQRCVVSCVRACVHDMTREELQRRRARKKGRRKAETIQKDQRYHEETSGIIGDKTCARRERDEMAASPPQPAKAKKRKEKSSICTKEEKRKIVPPGPQAGRPSLGPRNTNTQSRVERTEGNKQDEKVKEQRVVHSEEKSKD